MARIATLVFFPKYCLSFRLDERWCCWPGAESTAFPVTEELEEIRKSFGRLEFGDKGGISLYCCSANVPVKASLGIGYLEVSANPFRILRTLFQINTCLVFFTE